MGRFARIAIFLITSVVAMSGCMCDDTSYELTTPAAQPGKKKNKDTKVSSGLNIGSSIDNGDTGGGGGITMGSVVGDGGGNSIKFDQRFMGLVFTRLDSYQGCGGVNEVSHRYLKPRIEELRCRKNQHGMICSNNGARPAFHFFKTMEDCRAFLDRFAH